MTNSVTGGAGDDVLLGTANSDFVSLGKGADTYTDENYASDTIFGGEGNDLIHGGNGPDYIEGNAGSDILNGRGGNDSMSGGMGNDVIEGGEGINVLSGDQGSDYINSATESLDSIIAGNGDQILLNRSKNTHIKIEGDDPSASINPNGYGYISIDGEDSTSENITLQLSQDDEWDISYNDDESAKHDYTVFKVNNERILLRSIDAITVSQAGQEEQTIGLISNTHGDAHDYGRPQYAVIDSLDDFVSAVNETNIEFR